MSALGDHPHTDPGDGRSECTTCGKWVWMALHSCKGVPVKRLHGREGSTQHGWDAHIDLAALVVAAVRPIVIRECAEAIEADMTGPFWIRSAYAKAVRGLAGEAK